MEQGIGADCLEEGDTFEECGMFPVTITKVSSHGDTILIWGTDEAGSEVTLSLDRDDVVCLLARKEGASIEQTNRKGSFHEPTD